MCELIRSQVTFGLTYVDEARSAHHHGRGEYAEVARTIALNAYATANRFASRLSSRFYSPALDGLEQLRYAIESVWPSAVAAKEIA